MNVKYLVLDKHYFSKKRKYKMYAGVKYRIKKEDNQYYYTVKRIKFPKRNENLIYSVFEKSR